MARGRGGFPEDKGYYDDGYDDDERSHSRSSRRDGRGERAPHTIPLADGFDGYDGYTDERALASYDNRSRLPAVVEDETGPVIIAGTGVPMGDPFIQRRERPLSMRLTIIGLAACIIVTGMFAVTPLGADAGNSISSFQAISGSLVLSKDPAYFWYTAVNSDTPESIAKKFHIQIGGFYELNNLLAGQEIQTGIAYKIPEDPNYGADYVAPQFVTTGGGNGTTVFGSTLWTSYAGDPGPDSEVICAPNGDATGVLNPAGYQLQPPDPGAGWVRGFSWYHNGDDLAAPNGNPIKAAQSGQVIWSGWDVGGFGWSIKINHCNHLSTLYGHMSKLLVKAGDIVEVGQEIGLEGSSGDSTGPHLHFGALIDNNFVDPLQFYNWNISNIL